MLFTEFTAFVAQPELANIGGLREGADGSGGEARQLQQASLLLGAICKGTLAIAQSTVNAVHGSLYLGFVHPVGVASTGECFGV